MISNVMERIQLSESCADYRGKDMVKLRLLGMQEQVCFIKVFVCFYSKIIEIIPILKTTKTV